MMSVLRLFLERLAILRSEETADVSKREAEEQRAFAQWVAHGESEAARREATEILRLWSMATEPLPPQPTNSDTEHAWQRLQKQLSLQKEKTAVAHPPLVVRLLGLSMHMRPRLAIAAVVLILLSLGLGFWLLRPSKHLEQLPWKVYRHEASPPHLITLSNGTQMWLREGARVAYPQQADARIRQVRLSQGEIYLEVSPDATRPFELYVKEDLRVVVLGTAFALRLQAQRAVLSVQEGRVRIESQKGMFPAQQLHATEQMHIFTDGRFERKQLTHETYRAWQSGELVFRSTPLVEVLQEVSKHYGIKLLLHEPLKNPCRLTATLNGQARAEAFQLLADLTAGHIQPTNQPTTYYLQAPTACDK